MDPEIGSKLPPTVGYTIRAVGVTLVSNGIPRMSVGTSLKGEKGLLLYFRYPDAFVRESHSRDGRFESFVEIRS